MMNVADPRRPKFRSKPKYFNSTALKNTGSGRFPARRLHRADPGRPRGKADCGRYGLLLAWFKWWEATIEACLVGPFPA